MIDDAIVKIYTFGYNNYGKSYNFMNNYSLIFKESNFENYF